MIVLFIVVTEHALIFNEVRLLKNSLRDEVLQFLFAIEVLVEVLTLLSHHVRRHRVDSDHLLHLVIDAAHLEQNNTEQNIPREVIVSHKLTKLLKLTSIRALIDLCLSLTLSTLLCLL